jgi:hypothetical protein
MTEKIRQEVFVGIPADLFKLDWRLKKIGIFTFLQPARPG